MEGVPAKNYISVNDHKKYLSIQCTLFAEIVLVQDKYAYPSCNANIYRLSWLKNQRKLVYQTESVYKLRIVLRKYIYIYIYVSLLTIKYVFLKMDYHMTSKFAIKLNHVTSTDCTNCFPNSSNNYNILKCHTSAKSFIVWRLIINR